MGVRTTLATGGMKHIEAARTTLLELSTEDEKEILAVMHLLTSCVDIMEVWLERNKNS